MNKEVKVKGRSPKWVCLIQENKVVLGRRFALLRILETHPLFTTGFEKTRSAVMYELSLYGAVSAENHDRLVQQLAGVICMQPQEVQDIHLVFKTRTPSGIDRVQGSSGGSGTQQQQQEMQRLKNMLQSGIFFVHLVGSPRNQNVATQLDGNQDTDMKKQSVQQVDWMFEFKDTPESAKQNVITRLMFNIKIQGGEVMSFMDAFGFEYINRYAVEGQRFFAQDTTLLLHRIRRLPQTDASKAINDLNDLFPLSNMKLLDESGCYLLQAFNHIVDGNDQALRNTATKQLTDLSETLRPEINLALPDRLSLDTRITIPLRRI